MFYDTGRKRIHVAGEVVHRIPIPGLTVSRWGRVARRSLQRRMQHCVCGSRRGAHDPQYGLSVDILEWKVDLVRVGIDGDHMGIDGQE